MMRADRHSCPGCCLRPEQPGGSVPGSPLGFSLQATTTFPLLRFHSHLGPSGPFRVLSVEKQENPGVRSAEEGQAGVHRQRGRRARNTGACMRMCQWVLRRWAMRDLPSDLISGTMTDGSSVRVLQKQNSLAIDIFEDVFILVVRSWLT